MDRFGRLYSIVPAFTVMAIGLVLLGLDSATGVAVASVLIGGGNGLTSGAVLTLGADLVSRERRALPGRIQPGNQSGPLRRPLVVGTIAEFAGLTASAVALGDPDRRGGRSRW